MAALDRLPCDLMSCLLLGEASIGEVAVQPHVRHLFITKIKSNNVVSRVNFIETFRKLRDTQTFESRRAQLHTTGEAVYHSPFSNVRCDQRYVIR
jgi:hypothetical protein